MSRRPRVRPWRNTISGAHLPNGASWPTHGGTRALVALGVAIRTWIVSATALAGLAWNAPLAGSSRLKVVMSVSRISSMLLFGTPAGTPNLANAVAGADAV